MRKTIRAGLSALVGALIGVSMLGTPAMADDGEGIFDAEALALDTMHRSPVYADSWQHAGGEVIGYLTPGQVYPVSRQILSQSGTEGYGGHRIDWPGADGEAWVTSYDILVLPGEVGADAYTQWATVTEDVPAEFGVYRYPSHSSRIVAEARPSTALETAPAKAFTYDYGLENWIPARIGDVTGWVEQEYLVALQASSTAELNPELLAADAAIYEEPSASSTPVCRLVAGQTVQAGNGAGGWVQAQYGDSAGWLQTEPTGVDASVTTCAELNGEDAPAEVAEPAEPTAEPTLNVPALPEQPAEEAESGGASGTLVMLAVGVAAGLLIPVAYRKAKAKREADAGAASAEPDEPEQL